MNQHCGKIILVVEDEPAVRRALADKFSGVGFSIIEAKDGEEGFAAAEKGKPDLIILDLLMPKMDGMTMMKKLRLTEWGKKIPIVILTNLSADDKVIYGVTHDEPSFYLLKTDWTMDDVVSKVNAALGLD
ncbi:MAG: response regulator [Patescibacteria group bacterium]|nr:response regulator [Patescibacteria group bacterium]MCL5261831.1 response regulator [Patescibacteria group bacterium]